MAVDLHHWIIFTTIILGLLLIDLWHFHYYPHTIKMKEAILTTIGWVGLALLFNIWIFYEFGKEPALTFLAGYLIEESLSIDNLFVILLIFKHFAPPR